MWWKWLYWKKGICAKDFFNENINDIRDIIDIENAVSEKAKRVQSVQKMMGNIR